MRFTFPGRIAFGIALLTAAALRAGPQAPELRVAAPPGLVSGTVIETSARIATSESNILSWSLSVTHEGLEVLAATTAGTDFDGLSKGGYAESGVHPDGTAYYSIAVLSFTDAVTLPVGAPEVLRARCLITRKDPGEVKVIPRDGLKLPGDDREFSNAVLIQGGDTVPLLTSEKAFTVKGCAAFALAVGPAGPGEAASKLEVRRDTKIEVDVLVRVASADHLNPTGFSLGVVHDAALLALDSAELLASFTDGFVKADGFARIETSPAGFAAAVLSSATDPSTLGPGDHSIAKAVYRFEGSGHAGDLLTAKVSMSDALSLAGNPVKTLFEPRDALPCELPELPLSLEIGPDWWIRGDGNADGKADLSDAVATLRYLFLGDAPQCLRAMEVNLDGHIDLSDSVALLSHLFLGATPPAPPYPSCGVAEETLECAKFPCPAV